MNDQEYHAVDNNCQNWVIILLDEVDPSKSLSKSLEKMSFPEEFDDTTRSCNVSIYLTPLQRAKAIARKLDSAKHWAVIFEFDNRRILFEMTHEGGKKYGPIKPNWRDFAKSDEKLFSKVSFEITLLLTLLEQNLVKH